MADTIIGKQIGNKILEELAGKVFTYIKNRTMGRLLFVPVSNRRPRR